MELRAFRRRVELCPLPLRHRVEIPSLRHRVGLHPLNLLRRQPRVKLHAQP